jgi:hypothetical protein
MKRDLLILRTLQALIAIQILVGILSIFTLNIGRAIAVFGSAALIYLGITIIQQLVSIRDLLSYSSGQQPIKREVAQTSILSQLRKNKKEAAAPEPGGRSPRQPEDNHVTENRAYTVRTASAQGEDLS